LLKVTNVFWARGGYKEILSTHGTSLGSAASNEIAVWRYPSLKAPAIVEGHDGRILHAALHPEGHTLATAASDETLKFWEIWPSAKHKGKDRASDKEVDELALATSKLSVR
jgi:cell division cycle 20-like protein 1 (cofactor of APC complex)